MTLADKPVQRAGVLETAGTSPLSTKSRAKKNESAVSHIPGSIGREKSYFGYVGGGDESSAKMTAVFLSSSAVLESG